MLEKLSQIFVLVPEFAECPFRETDWFFLGLIKPGSQGEDSRFFWFAVCLIGMVIQNVFVTIGYFKYVTTTEITIDIEDEFIPPAFSVCAFLGDLINHRAFPEDHDCHKEIEAIKDDPVNYIKCVKSYQNYPIHEIMKRMTHNLSDMISVIQLGDDRFGAKPVNSLELQVDEFYFDYKRCIRIKYNPSPDFKIKNSDISRISNIRLIYLTIYGKGNVQEVLQQFHVPLLHRPHSIPAWFRS